MNRIRTNIRKALTAAALLLLTTLAFSCYIPSPLYGTWTDGSGNQNIIFMDDGTFSANIKNSDGTLTPYTGEWLVIDNCLSLSIKGESNYMRNADWSLNGAILYINWVSEDNSRKQLTLYHTAR